MTAAKGGDPGQEGGKTRSAQFAHGRCPGFCPAQARHWHVKANIDLRRRYIPVRPHPLLWRAVEPAVEEIKKTDSLPEGCFK
jgi:hypothetical protein